MTKTDERDFYFTVSDAIRAPELKISGSRFIADLIPVISKDEVDVHLDRIRKEFYDATHHCYAYRIGNNGEIIRAADDGEPAGTAGRPILMLLEGADLTNILCIVTRYYGGTKLGTGGLARAYSEASHLAISSALRKEVLLTQTMAIDCSYDELPALERYLIGLQLRPYDSTYGRNISMKINIRRSLVHGFQEEIKEKFLGKVSTSLVE